MIFNILTKADTNVKSFIVTGTSSGIGKAICEALIKKKIRVVGVNRNSTSGMFDSSYYKSYQIDLANVKTLHKDLENLIKESNQIRGLISCAGVGSFGSIENFSLKQIEQALKINLLSHIALTRYIVPVLKKLNSGDLIYIGSEAALEGSKQGSLYSAAKFGLRGFTQSIRAEVANKNIRVMLVNPGMVRTNFFNQLSFEPGFDAKNSIPIADIVKVVVNILEVSQNASVDEIIVNPIVKKVTKKTIDGG